MCRNFKRRLGNFKRRLGLIQLAFSSARLLDRHFDNLEMIYHILHTDKESEKRCRLSTEVAWGEVERLEKMKKEGRYEHMEMYGPIQKMEIKQCISR